MGEDASVSAKSVDRLGTAFRRSGLVGFWVQILIGAIPVGVAVLLFTTNRGPLLPGGRITVVALFSLASLAILVFTTLWFLGYARLGARLRRGEGALPSPARLARTVWIGLAASSLGVLLSMAVMVFEVSYIFVSFLEVPQAGVPVIQTDTSASFISAIDILGLLTLIFTVAAEVVALVIGLWLLHRVTALAAHPEPSGARYG